MQGIIVEKVLLRQKIEHRTQDKTVSLLQSSSHKLKHLTISMSLHPHLQCYFTWYQFATKMLDSLLGYERRSKHTEKYRVFSAHGACIYANILEQKKAFYT